jgi:ABC-type cobalt transport system substrate-binding protein
MEPNMETILISLCIAICGGIIGFIFGYRSGSSDMDRNYKEAYNIKDY